MSFGVGDSAITKSLPRSGEGGMGEGRDDATLASAPTPLPSPLPAHELSDAKLKPASPVASATRCTEHADAYVRFLILERTAQ